MALKDVDLRSVGCLIAGDGGVDEGRIAVPRLDAAARQSLLADTWAHTMTGWMTHHIVEDTPVESSHGDALAVLLHEAEATFRSRTALHPNYADAHHHLSICQRGLGRIDQALRASQRALELNPNYHAAAQQRDTLQRKAA